MRLVVNNNTRSSSVSLSDIWIMTKCQSGIGTYCNLISRYMTTSPVSEFKLLNKGDSERVFDEIQSVLNRSMEALDKMKRILLEEKSVEDRINEVLNSDSSTEVKALQLINISDYEIVSGFAQICKEAIAVDRMLESCRVQISNPDTNIHQPRVSWNTSNTNTTFEGLHELEEYNDEDDEEYFD